MHKILLSGPQKFSHPKMWASKLPTLRTTALYNTYKHKQVCLGAVRGAYLIPVSMRYVAHVCKMCTVKPVYNDHPRDPKIVVVVDRWFLFRGCFML